MRRSKTSGWPRLFQWFAAGALALALPRGSGRGLGSTVSEPDRAIFGKLCVVTAPRRVRTGTVRRFFRGYVAKLRHWIVGIGQGHPIIARAAFRAAVEQYQNSRIRLRNRAPVMEEHKPKEKGRPERPERPATFLASLEAFHCRMQRPSTRVIPVAHLTAARPAARRVAVRTQTPLTLCIPAPQASRTSVSVSSACGGASGMACADDARATAKAAAINLVMVSSQWSGVRGRWRATGTRLPMRESRTGFHA